MCCLEAPHDRAKLSKEMAAVNATMKAKIFTEDELRQVVGMYPLPEYDSLTDSTAMPVEEEVEATLEDTDTEDEEAPDVAED